MFKGGNKVSDNYNKPDIDIELIDQDLNNNIDENLEEKKNKKKYLLLLLLLLIFFSTIVVGLIAPRIINYFNNKNSISGSLPSVDGNAKPGIIPGMSKEEIEKIMQSAADESMFSFQINSKLEFENGKSEAKLLLGNPPNNVYNFHIEIILDGTNEQVYKSGILQPNYHIENVNLNRNLDKGSYAATAYFYIYNKAGTEVAGKSAAGLNIEIKS